MISDNGSVQSTVARKSVREYLNGRSVEPVCYVDTCSIPSGGNRDNIEQLRNRTDEVQSRTTISLAAVVRGATDSEVLLESNDSKGGHSCKWSPLENVPQKCPIGCHYGVPDLTNIQREQYSLDATLCPTDSVCHQ